MHTISKLIIDGVKNRDPGIANHKLNLSITYSSTGINGSVPAPQLSKTTSLAISMKSSLSVPCYFLEKPWVVELDFHDDE